MSYWWDFRREEGVDGAFRSELMTLTAPLEASLRYLPVPEMVPPVPMPATKCVTLWSVASQISGPVV